MADIKAEKMLRTECIGHLYENADVARLLGLVSIVYRVAAQILT